MKKITTLLTAIIGMAFMNQVSATHVTVEVPTAGQLSSSVQNANCDSITISGNLDGNDFWFIREQMPNLIYLNIGKVTVPDNKLPESGLYSKKALQKIILPDNLGTIGNHAFAYCSNLKDITFPKSLVTIEYNAFYQSGLSEAILPENLKEIGDGVFYECYNLEKVTFPKTLVTIGNNAFRQCNLSEITLPDSLKTIGNNAFRYCQQLQKVTFPEKLKTIGTYAFSYCNQLLLINWNAQAAITAESFDTPAKMGNLLIFAPEGTGCTYEGNVVINGMAEKISLTHGKGFRSPQAFKAKDITYKRNFSMKSGNKINAAGWEAIVLPFDVQSFSNEKQGELAPFNSGKKGAKPFWLAQMTTDGFEHTTAMKANKPYIISLPNSESYEDEFNISGEVQFHAEDAGGVEVKATSYKELARIEGSNRIMIPAYETVFKHDTVYAINPATYENIAPGGAFVRNLRDVQPFEAYLISKEAAVNAPKLYSIGGIGGEITGIEELPSDAWNGIEIYVRYGVLYIKSDRERTLSIYDTAGHMVRQVEVQEGTTAVTGLGKGIYLLARKKILVQ